MLNKIAAMRNKTATPKSTQKTITIDQELWSELESWLSSKQAKKLGYHSKAQFATEAVRNLLEKYTSGRNVEKEILDRIDNLRMEVLGTINDERKKGLLVKSGTLRKIFPTNLEKLLKNNRD